MNAVEYAPSWSLPYVNLALLNMEEDPGRAKALQITRSGSNPTTALPTMLQG
ncbi:MAG: hypothetical protein IPM34_13255 [Saprospiraceae bacterium]|nr:hypothetical protein [Saprospiraceae bacterium]